MQQNMLKNSSFEKVSKSTVTKHILDGSTEAEEERLEKSRQIITTLPSKSPSLEEIINQEKINHDG